jgi:hypothetical protein
MNTTMQKIEFSKNLARLFYAIAASDKRVRKTEIKTLKKLIWTDWSDLLDSKNNKQFDQHYQIELEFDRLVEEQPDPNNCFDDFVNYKLANQEQFNQNILELIWKTANSIAISFSGKNKSELILLTKLKMNLQQ